MARDTRTAPVARDEQPSFEKQRVAEDVFLDVLGASIAAIEEAGIQHLMIGGIPSEVMGRARWTEDGADIDFFVKPKDADNVLEALERAGFATKKAEEDWLYKATKGGVVVDVIFRSTGDIYLDDDMAARSFPGEFKGVPVKLVSAEDLLVMKAIAHNEQTARYWYDALGLLGRTDLDWDYVIGRALHHGAHRTLSLLIYAQSNDIHVPNAVIRRLFDAIYES